MWVSTETLDRRTFCDAGAGSITDLLADRLLVCVDKGDPMTAPSDATSTQNRYVVFDLPFPLRIRNSVPGDGQQAAPMFIGVKPPCELSTVVVESETEVQGVRGAGELEGGDPYGRWSHTRVQARFHSVTSAEVKTWDDRTIVYHAVAAANVLIAHYRDLAFQPLVRELSALDIVHFKIVEEFGSGNAREHWYSTGRSALVFGIDEARQRMEDSLRERTGAAAPVEFLRQLQLDVEAHLSSGDHRLAVIEMATLFEAWLRRYIVQALTTRSSSPLDIERRFTTRSGRFMGVTDIARTLVPQTLGFDFLNSPAGLAWKRDLRDLRNSLVHGSRETVTAQEARQAIAAGRGAREAIMRHAPTQE